MEVFLPIVVTWGLLCAVLVAYVVYRFVTDRSKGSQRHPLYPLVSRPTDPSFPAQGAWIQWAAYICLLAVPCGLLGALASDMDIISAPWSGMIAGLGLLLGLLFLALAKLLEKNN